MTNFTPRFLEKYGTQRLAEAVDNSLLESKFNGKSVTDNLFECLRDDGYSIEDSRQNSEHIVSFVERGIFWTRLSLTEYGLPNKSGLSKVN